MSLIGKRSDEWKQNRQITSIMIEKSYGMMKHEDFSIKHCAAPWKSIKVSTVIYSELVNFAFLIQVDMEDQSKSKTQMTWTTPSSTAMCEVPAVPPSLKNLGM